jgi:hypothetical protein
LYRAHLHEGASAVFQTHLHVLGLLLLLRYPQTLYLLFHLDILHHELKHPVLGRHHAHDPGLQVISQPPPYTGAPFLHGNPAMTVKI